MMKQIRPKIARLFAGLAQANVVQNALVKMRRIKPLVAVAIVLVLFAGVTLARAVGGGTDATVTADPTPTPTTSPSPSQEPAGVTAEGGGGGAVNNEVVVLNITDGRFAHRARAGMARVTGGPVTNTNSAAATSSCTNCRTVAVAAQAVLVMGDSSVVSPKNQAVAINQNCTRCESYALAYQYVVSTGGISHLTSEGQQSLSSYEAEIRELAGSRLPFLELEAQIDAVVEKMWAAVDEEVVSAGGKPSGNPRKSRDQATSDGPTPTPSESPESPSPSPSESPSTEPTDQAGSLETSESPAPTTSEVPEEEPTESPSPT